MLPVSFNSLDATELRTRLDAAGLEHEGDEIVVKREISQNGKGRTFVNNQLVSVGFLKEIARFLADIHGQNEQQIPGRKRFPAGLCGWPGGCGSAD